jgi:hypothetical protein
MYNPKVYAAASAISPLDSIRIKHCDVIDMMLPQASALNRI